MLVLIDPLWDVSIADGETQNDVISYNSPTFKLCLNELIRIPVKNEWEFNKVFMATVVKCEA